MCGSECGAQPSLDGKGGVRDNGIMKNNKAPGPDGFPAELSEVLGDN